MLKSVQVLDIIVFRIFTVLTTGKAFSFRTTTRKRRRTKPNKERGAGEQSERKLPTLRY